MQLIKDLMMTKRREMTYERCHCGAKLKGAGKKKKLHDHLGFSSTSKGVPPLITHTPN